MSKIRISAVAVIGGVAVSETGNLFHFTAAAGDPRGTPPVIIVRGMRRSCAGRPFSGKPASCSPPDVRQSFGHPSEILLKIAGSVRRSGERGGQETGKSSPEGRCGKRELRKRMPGAIRILSSILTGYFKNGSCFGNEGLKAGPPAGRPVGRSANRRTVGGRRFIIRKIQKEDRTGYPGRSRIPCLPWLAFLYARTVFRIFTVSAHHLISGTGYR